MRLSVSLALVFSAAFAGAGCHSSNSGHGGGGNGGGGNGGNGGPPPTCTANGACQQSCTGGGTTTLTGKVYAPNGKLPLYNAIVYVPSSNVDAFTTGATCDRCNGTVSGNPIVQTLTDATGSFSLANVPVGADIPLVIQLGKWRRQVTIPAPAKCQTTAIDAVKTSLPGDHTQGDMPQMAIATGFIDPLECLLLKLGISSSEITVPAGGGKVHFYLGASKPGTTMPGAASEETALFTSIDNLMKYDIVMLPCEGTAVYDKSNNGPGRGQLVEYLKNGGRLFATHYSYNWLTYLGSPFNNVALQPPPGGKQWPFDQTNPATPYPGTLDTTFPKGMAFATWLNAVQSPGQRLTNNAFDIVDPRNDINQVDPSLAQRWIYNADDNKTQHLTFNTPVDAPTNDMGGRDYCGRVVFSDFHVSANAVSTSAGAFPTVCKNDELTTQEKALIFMLFDLSSCVQSDQLPPIT